MAAATEILTEMAAAYYAELAEVRAQYGRLSLADTQRLMARTGQSSPQDAYAEESRQRCRRNQWAAISRAP